MHLPSLAAAGLSLVIDLAGAAALTGRPALYHRLAQVRPVDRICAELIERGTRSSPTFRRLVTAIEASDIIVYLECRGRLPLHVIGVTRLAAYAGRHRYVRVSIDERVAGDEAVSILGHELYHVNELARATHVVDAVSMRELYMMQGHRSCSGEPPCFDTPEARHAGDVVLRELRNALARHWRTSRNRIR